MNIIIVSLILGAIALAALYWPKPKAGKGEVIVRLYNKGNLVLTGCAETKTIYLDGKMIVTEATMPNLFRDVRVDRVTLAIPEFPELQKELEIDEPFNAYRGCDLTLAKQNGEPGILVVS